MKITIDLDDLSVTVDPPVEGAEGIEEVYKAFTALLFQATEGADKTKSFNLKISVDRVEG